ncbi:MAG: type II toxin-antitoxin system VapC family toxin [Nocardioides sp.]
MIALDTNILVYAHMPGSQFHEPARRCLSELANSGRRIAIPWSCVHEFLSTTTHPKVFPAPSSAGRALEAMGAFAQLPTVEFLSETARHLEIVTALIGGEVIGPKVHDARIAAICLGHGVDELWTADRDFSYFPALKTRNPLVGGT